MDIAVLQETRLAAEGMLPEKNYMFYWWERSPEEHTPAWHWIHSQETLADNDRTPTQVGQNVYSFFDSTPHLAR